MSVPTNNVQIIEQSGKPAFAVIPYDDYLELTEQKRDNEALIPHEVVGLVIKNNWNLAKAWRKHLGISQKELSKKANISQSALSQMENSDNLKSKTLEKLAKALGINADQLID